MKPMLVTAADKSPEGLDWIYEAKYDGFRCILEWESEDKTPILKSRNDNILNHKFPEIISYCKSILEEIKSYLPIKMDGEIVYLMNDYQSNFSTVQKRGRMRKVQTIEEHSSIFPCHYVVFDLLVKNGEFLISYPLTLRKQLLTELFNKVKLPQNVRYMDSRRIQAIEVFEDLELLWEKIKTYNGEGVIDKKKDSKWIEGSRTKHWLKIKNWRIITVVVFKYVKSNNYFIGGVYRGNRLYEVVAFKHGFDAEEFNTLVTFFIDNGQKQKGTWFLTPSICVDIACIDFDGTSLREPRFHSFRFDVRPETCTWSRMQRQLNPIPEEIEITHPDKPIFPLMNIKKDDYLLYLQTVSPYFLPFLQDRSLTLIRYPHGVPGDSFYQKSIPDNAPAFLNASIPNGSNNQLICNNIQTLLWLGNQLALEFHIPFQKFYSDKPSEIVFDLDPPSVNDFNLAVFAAQKMKMIFDRFNLKSFVKTSGGKGMQVYIPLPFDTFTYEDTAIFTEFICSFLVEQYPDIFTIERLKKNRGNRLYLDYVQHRKGKTIIAPYSTRANEQGLVATPLEWQEVDDSLRPEKFTIPSVMERLKNTGNPFRDYREVRNRQAFDIVLNQFRN